MAITSGVTQADLDNLKQEMVAGFNSLGRTLSAEFNQRFDRVETQLHDLDASFKRNAADVEQALNEIRANQGG